MVAAREYRILGAPVGVVEFDGAGQQIACGVVELLFGAGQQHLVDRGVRTQLVTVGQPVLGGPGPAAQRVQGQIRFAHIRVGGLANVL